MKKALSFVLALMFALTTLAACGAPAAPASAPSASATETESAKPDTISLLLPPVSTTYQDQLATWAKEFNTLYPNLTLEFETASWEDYKQKMDVQVNAGSPPDIAFVENDNVGKYLDSGLLVDLTTLIDPATLADFDENAVQFYRNGEGLYGLPVYISIQCLGGNKAMLEEAGIDWKSIQQKGWTYEEFRDSIQKGTKDGRYGFIFACAGVTAADYLNIMVKNAGMPAPFTKEMKYAYTNQNFLKLLESLRSIIDDGSTPKEMSSVDAGMRWNMFLTGQTMVFGKGMANFEGLAVANNAKIAANDGTAVADSKEAEYVVLPVPTFFGCEQAAQGAAGGYSMFRGKDEMDPTHQANVMKALTFMSTGSVAAYTCNELFLSGLSQSSRDEMAKITNEVPRSPENAAAVATLTAHAAEARPDIPAELLAKNSRMMDEVIVPKFQALLSGETTPQEMYDAVKTAAIETFGEDGIVKD
ncbi:MAG: extracellular solute-binding protein [Ruthenibacterium sp.]